jgi:glycosyltransferase involved in cell wall biosynthesis
MPGAPRQTAGAGRDVGRRVVLFDAYPHVYGGAQRTDHLLAGALGPLGWSMVVITPAEGPFTARLRADDLPVEVVPVPRPLGHYGRTTTGSRSMLAAACLPAYWLRLALVLRRLRPDVVHIVDHRGLVLAGPAARASRARVLWHVQAMDRSRWLNRLGARLAHCIVVPTDAVLDKMPELAGCADRRAIANVVPEHARRATPVPLATAPTIVTTGRLHPDKGLDLLVTALGLVRRAVPTARLRIIGGPQEGFEALADDLRAQAADLGLADAVELVGFVDRPEVIVADAACYVQPARERTEILPLAILEAMATGIPVVATDVGGVRDIVRDGDTGLLVEPEDADALAAAIVRVLDDRSLALRLRDGAFTLADERRFTPAGLVEATAAAYDGASHA